MAAGSVSANGDFNIGPNTKLEKTAGGNYGPTVPYESTPEGAYLNLKDPKAQLLAYLASLGAQARGADPGSQAKYSEYSNIANTLNPSVLTLPSAPGGRTSTMGGVSVLNNNAAEDAAFARAESQKRAGLMDSQLEANLANSRANTSAQTSKTDVRNQTFGGGQLRDLIQNILNHLTASTDNIPSTVG